MRRRNFKYLVLIFTLGVIIACNIPGVQPESSTALSTPNYTLTALFAPPQNIATQPLSPLPMVTDTPPLFLITSSPPDSPIESVSPTTSLSHTASPQLTSSLSPSPSEVITASPSATPTTAPSSTVAWSPCYRAGERFYAAHFSSPPVLDGVWDEWGATQYPATYVFYGSGNWTGSDDLSASFQVGWDSQNIYVAAKVIDDVYAQNATGQDIYKGDSIEILIDTNLCGDYYNTEINSGDDYQLGISPGRFDVTGTKEAFMWFPRSKTGERSEVSISSTRSGNVYRIEVAIPWSVFGVSPWAGQTLGFAFSVSDNDSASQNLQQSMATSVTTRRLTNPTTWGTLILK